MTTILALAQDAATELSLSAPGTLFGDSVTDEGTKLLRHLTRTCRSLAARYDWQKLRREHTFTTVATEAQTSATPIPTDFGRFVEGTIWNRTRTLAVEGPLTPYEYQAERANNVSRINPAFVIRNGLWIFTPAPSAGETIAYEYMTKSIGTDTTLATARTAFTVDTDETYFDDEMIVLGTVWRYRKAEGFDYAEDYREFELHLYNVLKMDGGRRKLSMNTDCPPDGPRPLNMPGIIVSVGGDGGSF